MAAAANELSPHNGVFAIREQTLPLPFKNRLSRRIHSLHQKIGSDTISYHGNHYGFTEDQGGITVNYGAVHHETYAVYTRTEEASIRQNPTGGVIFHAEQNVTRLEHDGAVTVLEDLTLDSPLSVHGAINKLLGEIEEAARALGYIKKPSPPRSRATHAS